MKTISKTYMVCYERLSVSGPGDARCEQMDELSLAFKMLELT